MATRASRAHAEAVPHCRDPNPPRRADSNERYHYILSGAWGRPEAFTHTFRLPAGVSCAGGCVLQWEYLTMNSCFEPCNRAVCGVYADRVNPITGSRNMATCCLGASCNSANVPEVFRNCADIAITGGSSGVPPPVNKCDKCNLPAAQGGCKCDANCNCIGAVNKCDKCNLPVAQGGCKCDANCDCITSGGGCARTAASGGSCGAGTCCPNGQCE